MFMSVAAAVALALVLLLVVVHRRPHKGIEAHELSAYHDGLDALTRLEARRVHPD